MNYEKQTYLNTERLGELYRRDTVLTASVPSESLVGGIRFVADTARSVRLEAVFPSLVGSYTPYLDGHPVMMKSSPSFSMEVTVDKGDHIFEIESAAAHGGAILRVTGVGIRAGKRYYERVGGYYTSTRTVLYMKRGDRNVDKMVFDGNAPTITVLSDVMYDVTQYYDKTERTYTSTLFYLRSSRADEVRVTLSSGTLATLSIPGVSSSAIADGRMLPGDLDCICACVDGNGVMHFYSAKLTGGVYEATTTIPGVKRVVSSQRGTCILVQDKENVWRAYVFGSEGDKSITVNGLTLAYSVQLLSRNAVCAPSADLISGVMRFYYRDGKGVLHARNNGGEEEVIGYAEEYYGGPYGMLLQDNEIAYEQ